MNKLSSCQIFNFVDQGFGLADKISYVSSNIAKYEVPFTLYDYFSRIFASYKYPLTKGVRSAMISGSIKPVMFQKPYDSMTEPKYIPGSILTISSPSRTWVDISHKGEYKRNKLGSVEALDIIDGNLYAMLQMAYVAKGLQNSDKADTSLAFVKNVATAYSILFSKCIDKKFPISSNKDRYNVSIFLSALYCMKTFFGKTTEDAMNIIFSTKICEKVDIYNDCKALNTNSIEFDGLQEFLVVYGNEFDDYIKKDYLNIQVITSLFTSMYGENSYFAIEHGITFVNMVITPDIGMYNNYIIMKLLPHLVKKIEETVNTLIHI